MEVQLSPEQNARLTELAGRTGKAPEQVILDAVDRLLEEETRFGDAVQKGFASLDRGEYVTHEEVRARIDRLLRP